MRMVLVFPVMPEPQLPREVWHDRVPVVGDELTNGKVWYVVKKVYWQLRIQDTALEVAPGIMCKNSLELVIQLEKKP